MRETKDIEMNSLAVECEDCMITERLNSMLQILYIADKESLKKRAADLW